ncbi:DgyrCDS3397 [Dimorphilus gyrociliatus]|uniref:DgyrCDS3397 n=1 Tax=Dimorphilus gyrociliatus TaxID=2664684 RepID=A0A7I8VG42_9ANNE|nr:DgyrCDS3397 [Dimorphilus gyrociliatus]
MRQLQGFMKYILFDVLDDEFYGNVATSVENDTTSKRTSSPLTPATEEDNFNSRREQEWRDELAKLEDDITTLRQVLHYKIEQTNELKHKLGITPIKEFQQDLKTGIQNIKESETYQKTGEVFKSVGAKMGGVFSLTKNKLGGMRNSTAFRSFEERIGGAVSNVKSRVRGSKTEEDFESVLKETKEEEARQPSIPSAPPS